MSEELYNLGFECITNIDFSNAVVEDMRVRNADLQNMDHIEMDVTSPMDLFESDGFNLIFDKGTFDCVTSSENYISSAKACLDNFFRLLEPGGIYFCVSYGKPETRLPYFKQNLEGGRFNVESVVKVPKPAHPFDRIDQEPYYYVYIL